jgi:thiamine transport system substrate-binding protein
MPAEGATMESIQIHHRQPISSSFLAFALVASCVAPQLLFPSCSRGGKKTLVVYAYDSFVSEWGPGLKAAKGFKEKTGIEVSIVPKGDAGQVLAAAIQEKKRPRADVLIGLDQNFIGLAREEGVLSPYAAEGLSRVPQRLRFSDNLLTPYDYGVFTIIWDSESGIQPPKSLADLSAPAFAKKLILMDPRTSSPGLGFLAWTLETYGDGWKDYWKSLHPSILTIASGWDSGYGLFLKGEAPLVLSYTTSPAYHLYAEDTKRYVALSFDQGHPVQIEGAGLVKGGSNAPEGRKFLDYLLSAEFQAIVTTTNWMFPVDPGVPLPECYSVVPAVKELEGVNHEKLAQALVEWPDAASR